MDPKETIVSDPLLLHDVITGTDHKENTSTVACLSVAIATVVNTCQQHARHTMNVCYIKIVVLTVLYSHLLSGRSPLFYSSTLKIEVPLAPETLINFTALYFRRKKSPQ
jgi:hypothetical protein